MARPRVIKKYANRKLYDMEERKYVTLAAVQAMVDSGGHVVVIDKETETDITDIVLERANAVAGSVQGEDTSGPADDTHASHPRPPQSSGATSPAGALASVLRASLTLPLELGQLAQKRLQSQERSVSAQEFDELIQRVTELEAEIAQLVEVLSKDTSALIKN